MKWFNWIYFNGNGNGSTMYCKHLMTTKFAPQSIANRLCSYPCWRKHCWTLFFCCDKFLYSIAPMWKCGTKMIGKSLEFPSIAIEEKIRSKFRIFLTKGGTDFGWRGNYSIFFVIFHFLAHCTRTHTQTQTLPHTLYGDSAECFRCSCLFDSNWAVSNAIRHPHFK